MEKVICFLLYVMYVFSCIKPRLCEKDPYQLYQRLEQQAREYVLETKVRLLKHLSAGSEATGATQGPPQAHQFISLLLEEYSALCQAARTISSFLLTLVSWDFGICNIVCPHRVQFVLASAPSVVCVFECGEFLCTLF